MRSCRPDPARHLDEQTATRCRPSTTSLPSVGITCARATPSKPCSRPCGQNSADERITIVNNRQADGVQAGYRCTKLGDGSKAQISSPR